MGASPDSSTFWMRHVLCEGQYRKAAKKAECPQTKSAVVMDGPDAGALLHVCRDDKCPACRRDPYPPTMQERATRAKEALAERVEKLTRVRFDSDVAEGRTLSQVHQESLRYRPGDLQLSIR